MSSKSIDKNFGKIEYEGKEKYFDLRRAIIPFSKFFLKDERYIYDGNEKIPFSKRDPLFKTILLDEFSNTVRKTNNKI